MKGIINMDLIELSSDIKQIELEIKHHKNIAGLSIWEIGRRLNHVKENDLVHGEWENWCSDKVDITPAYANRYIKVFKEFEHSNQYTSMGLNALYLIATMPVEERTKEHTLDTGAVKQVDEMTVRELQEVKRKLKQREDELLELKQTPPQIVEKEVEPEDYQFVKNRATTLENTIRTLKHSVQDKDLEIERVVKEKEILERKARLNEQESNKYKQLKSQIENLSKQKSDLGIQIKTRTELSGLVVRIEHILKTELAPIKYSKSIRDASDDKIVNDNLKDIVDRVQEWCTEMYGYVQDNDIINTEVIYYE